MKNGPNSFSTDSREIHVKEQTIVKHDTTETWLECVYIRRRPKKKKKVLKKKSRNKSVTWLEMKLKKYKLLYIYSLIKSLSIGYFVLFLSWKYDPF